MSNESFTYVKRIFDTGGWKKNQIESKKFFGQNNILLSLPRKKRKEWQNDY